MSNPGLGFQGGILGFVAESVYGTKVTPTKFIEINSDGLNVNEERLHSEAIPGIYSDDDEFSQGGIAIGDEIQFEMRYEGMELLIKHAMGAVASAETASFIIDATNKKIDFSIGAGALLATIAEGTYKAGATQADAGTLCKLIYDAIVAAENTGTYTVSFSTTTKKFTITRTAGTFSILWQSGTNTATNMATILGYSKVADDSGGLTYTSDTAVVPVFTHTFTLADDLPVGMTFEIDQDVTAFTIEGGKINTFGMSIEPKGFLIGTIGIIGEDVSNAAATSPTLPSSGLINFTQGAITFGVATISVLNASFTLNNNLNADRRFIGSRYIKEPMRKGKVEVTGKFSIEFESADQYTDFRAATSRALVLTFTGALIKTGQSYTLTITFPIIKLTGGMPKVGDPGILKMELPFKAYASDSSAREFNIALKNTLVSV